MWELILSGIVLALFSGAWFVAYKHNSAYRRIVEYAGPIVGGLTVAGLLATGFTIILFILASYQIATQIELNDETPLYVKSLVGQVIFIARLLFYMFVSGGVLIVVIAYLAFLWFLPKILEPEGQQRSDSETESNGEANQQV